MIIKYLEQERNPHFDDPPFMLELAHYEWVELALSLSDEKIDETKIDALKREIKEETGIDITTAEIEQIEGVLNGQSEKVLRETGEKVLVDMDFYNFKVTLQEKNRHG